MVEALKSKMADRGADVILIPKQLRMDWVDVMALDSRLSPVGLRIACVIGTHFGNKSGLTYISRETVARVAEVSLATAKRAIAELEERGYLIVRRREVGSRIDGSRAYGGRGIANEYLPACNSVQVSATDRGQRLVANVVERWNRKVEKGSKSEPVNGVTVDPLYSPNGFKSDPVSGGKRGSFRAVNGVTDDPPTLSSPSEKDSTGVREHRSTAGPLGAAGDVLRKRLGKDVFLAWFGKVSLVSENAETVTLSAPTQFIRNYIVAQFDAALIQSWQSIQPAIQRVNVVVGPPATNETGE
ncbi:MAG: hypothetical protein HY852_03565 [Bradyrhizobium sp.]|uniref:DnaA N-terminal domain-containing protein n=1 Tax=Bradyrhizobium sp. TaxID=376 RepID=UPI0025C37D17|nr:DnaA N-terminal domain-containing protein [Bradyrhizobium sp.]MBI5260881.1 hypothetical protein [Bradyrhizobium sp.]